MQKSQLLALGDACYEPHIMYEERKLKVHLLSITGCVIWDTNLAWTIILKVNYHCLLRIA